MDSSKSTSQDSSDTGENLYFVAVTANGCGACTGLKRKLGQRLEIIQQYFDKTSIKFIHINLPAMGVDPSDVKEYKGQVHPKLSSLIAWYPIYILFDSSWTKHSRSLNGLIYEGEKIKRNKRVNLTYPKVIEAWINNNKSKLFKSTKSAKIQKVVIDGEKYQVAKSRKTFSHREPSDSDDDGDTF